MALSKELEEAVLSSLTKGENQDKYNDHMKKIYTNKYIDDQYTEAKKRAEQEYKDILESSKQTLNDYISDSRGVDTSNPLSILGASIQQNGLIDFAKNYSTAKNKDTQTLLNNYTQISKRMSSPDISQSEYQKNKILLQMIDQELERKGNSLQGMARNFQNSTLRGVQNFVLGGEQAVLGKLTNNSAINTAMTIAGLDENQQEQVRKGLYNQYRDVFTKGGERDIQNQQLLNSLSYNGVAKLAMDGGFTVGEMTIPILLGVVTGNIATSAGTKAGMSAKAIADMSANASKVASLGSMYGDVFGHSYAEAIDSNASTRDAELYAHAMASAETLSEVIGGETIMSAMVGRPASSLIGKAVSKNVLSNVNSKALKGMIALVTDIGSESLEEIMTGLTDPLIKKVALGEDIKADEILPSLYEAAVGSIIPSIIFMGMSKPMVLAQVNNAESNIKSKIRTATFLTDEQKADMNKRITEITADARLGINDNYDNVFSAVQDEINQSYRQQSNIYNSVNELREKYGLSGQAMDMLLQDQGYVYNASNATEQQLVDKSKIGNVTYKNMNTINQELSQAMKADRAIQSITPVTTIDKVQQNIKNQIEKLTGKQVVFVNTQANGEKVHGFTNPSSNSQNIYINVGQNANDTLAASYHEIGHHYKLQHPELYKAFVSALNTKGLSEYEIEERFGNYIGQTMTKAENVKSVENKTRTIFENLKELGSKISNKAFGTDVNNTRVSAYNFNDPSYLGQDVLNNQALEQQVLNIFQGSKNNVDITKRQEYNKADESLETLYKNLVADNKTEGQIRRRIGLKIGAKPDSAQVTETINKLKSDTKFSKEVVSNDFRRLQEESRRQHDIDSRERDNTSRNEELRERLSRVLQGELDRRGYNTSTSNELTLKSNKGTTFNMYTDVDAKTFHDIFEIAKAYTNNGELVDLHEADDYKTTKNYLSTDGMSGFAITKDGDLISVFNADASKHGFLDAISGIVKENAKTLDCYASEKQNLMEMYQKKFGFKTASIMDYNMEYDHDNIAKNHNMPQVAFMVNTKEDVETKHFNKDQYDEAQAYQQSFVKNSNQSSFSNGYYTTVRGNSIPYATSKNAYDTKPAPGKIRLYHNTPYGNADSILDNGLLHDAGKRFRGEQWKEYEGDAIWFETRPDRKGYGGLTIAVEIDPNDEMLREMNDTQYMYYKDVKPEEIVFIDRPLFDDNRTSDLKDLISKYGLDAVVQVFHEGKYGMEKYVTDKEFDEIIDAITSGTIKFSKEIDKDKAITNLQDELAKKEEKVKATEMWAKRTGRAPLIKKIATRDSKIMKLKNDAMNAKTIRKLKKAERVKQAKMSELRTNLRETIKKFKKSEAFKFLTPEDQAMFNDTFGKFYTKANSKTLLTRMKEQVKSMVAEMLDEDPNIVISQHVKDMIDAPSQKTLSEIETLEELEDLMSALKDVITQANTEKQLIGLERTKDAVAEKKAFTDDVNIRYDQVKDKAVSREQKREQRESSTFGKAINALDSGASNFVDLIKAYNAELSTLKGQLTFMAGGNSNSRILDLHKNLFKGVSRERESYVGLNNTIYEFLEDKELRKSLSLKADFKDMGRNVVDTSGRTHRLRLNPSELISFAKLSMQEQSQAHISGRITDIKVDDNGRAKTIKKQGGGLTIPNEELLKQGKTAKAIKKGYTVKLSIEEINDILGKQVDENGNVYFSSLTEKENEFVKALTTKFFPKTAEYTNLVSKLRKGYAIADVENYFPIMSNKAYIYSRFDNEKLSTNLVAELLGLMDNMGFLNSRNENAFNPIVLESITDVVTRMMKGVSKYYGYDIALYNNKVLLSSQNEDGVSVVNMLNEIDDTFMNNYEELTGYLSGKLSHPNDWFAKFRGKHAEFTLGLNPSVWVKQLLSVPTTLKYFKVSDVLGYVFGGEAKLHSAMKSFLEQYGETKRGKTLHDFVRYMTSDLDYRDLGFGLVDAADAKDNKSVFERFDIFKGISRADMLGVNTVTRLVLFSELNARGLLDGQLNELTDEELDKTFDEVGYKLESILRETQPDYAEVNRSNISRKSGVVPRLITMYSTALLQMYNNFSTSFSEASYAAKTKDSTLIKLKGSQLAKSAVGLMIASTLSVAITRMFDKFLKQKDDDDEFDFGKEVVVSSLAPTLILDDVARGVLKLTTYESQTPELAAYDAIINLAGDVGELASAPEEKKFKQLEKIIKNIGLATGIPTRDLMNITRTTLLVSGSDLYYQVALRENQYAYKAWLEKNTGQDVQDFYKAYIGTRDSKLIEAGYVKGTKSGQEGSKKDAFKKALQKVFPNDSKKVNEYMTILGGYKK